MKNIKNLNKKFVKIMMKKVCN